MGLGGGGGRMRGPIGLYFPLHEAMRLSSATPAAILNSALYTGIWPGEHQKTDKNAHYTTVHN